MSWKRGRRRERTGIELIDLPDEPAERLDAPAGDAPAGDAEQADPDRTKRRLRNHRLKITGVAAAAVAALIVAWQVVPSTPADQGRDAGKGATNNVPRATNRPRAGDAKPVGATAGDCDLAGLSVDYPDATAIATSIRSALVAQVDPSDKHVQSPAQEVNCLWPDGTDHREIETVLSWSDNGYQGLIIVNVANFDDPAMTGCGTGWLCDPTATTNIGARTARLIRDTGDRGFGVVVQRTDGQYVSIEAGAASITNNDIDPTRSLDHFPFGATALLRVAVDPRVHLDREITPPH